MREGLGRSDVGALASLDPPWIDYGVAAASGCSLLPLDLEIQDSLLDTCPPWRVHHSPRSGAGVAEA